MHFFDYFSSEKIDSELVLFYCFNYFYFKTSRPTLSLFFVYTKEEKICFFDRRPRGAITLCLGPLPPSPF